MPPPIHRPYLGESAEQRVETRRKTLIDTAFAQLSDDGGWRGLSIAQLCRDAQLNKRYFYESFSDLESLAGAVVDDLAVQLLGIGSEAAIEAMSAGMDTATLARQVLGRVIGWLVEDPRRPKVLFTTMSDHPHTQAHRQETINTLAQGLSAFSLDYHHAPGPLPIAQIGSAMLIGGSAEIILGWLSGQFDMTFDELLDDVAALWVAVGDGAIAATKRRRDGEGSKVERGSKPRR
ncbi:MAG: hypothetical protein R3B40_22975 [Polyangiales bacterium]|nr:hypothetical protein [Myxococcales bacterium]MCB9659457.1 hypothetical protein [Sandaracinaceae bacterium]